MTYELTQKPAFFHDLIQLPHAEQKKVIRALERLAAQPFAGQTKRIFGHAFKNLYRHRTGAYRIVFAAGSRTLSLLGIGKRDEVYDRFRPSGAPAQPSAEAVRPEPTHLPTVPEDPAPAHALPDGGDEADPEEEKPKPEGSPATSALLKELLELWDVPKEACERVLSCNSADELLDAGLPADVLEAVLHV